jgi:ethanolaminephosphotransferase
VSLATEHIQILHRNALQILDIVKATFPNEAYDGPSGVVNCDRLESSGAELACHWRTCNERLNAGNEILLGGDGPYIVAPDSEQGCLKKVSESSQWRLPRAPIISNIPVAPASLLLVSLSANFSMLQFCWRAQDIMSSTASNYDVSRLVSGIILASISLVLVVLAAWGFPLLTQLDSLFFLCIVLLYGVMMFASSYVEEEQHFWYWVTGGWIVFQSIRK